MSFILRFFVYIRSNTHRKTKALWRSADIRATGRNDRKGDREGALRKKNQRKRASMKVVKAPRKVRDAKEKKKDGKIA